MQQFDDDFFSTSAGQFIAGAHRYISAARVLRYSDEWEARANLLQTPTLHVLAHGVELLLKYPFIRNGSDQSTVAHEFGHDLRRLWNADINANLRREVLASAENAWSAARDSGKWQDDMSADPQQTLTAAVYSLSHLHGRNSSFALRYTIEGPTLAPRPAFLIDAFGDVAERTVKNPRYLDD